MSPPNRTLDEASLKSAWHALAGHRRASVLLVAGRLKAAGHRAWLVGGAVRDLALGHGVGDLDMVSAATPDEALALFPKARGIGKSFGIVHVEEASEGIELATFRLEDGYRDGRHPDAVRFTDSLELDAKRRDFTCNALYFDPLEEVLCDPTGGLSDLCRGRLCTVGEPSARFAEDGLRLLRVARFLARLDLEPGPGLLEAAHGARGALRGVSAERIYGEMERMANGPRADRAFWALWQAGLLGPAFSVGAQSNLPEESQRHETLRGLLERVDPVGIVAWLVLGLDPKWSEPSEWTGHHEPFLEALRALKVPRSVQIETVEVCRYRRLWRRWQLPEDAAEILLCLRTSAGRLALGLARAQAQVSGHTADLHHLNAWFGWYEALPNERVFPSYLPNGVDLMAEGVAAGPALGRALEAIERAALEGRFHDHHGALAWWRSWANSGPLDR